MKNKSRCEIRELKLELESKDVAIAGIIGALYTALGYIFQPISFLGIQFRIAEIIVGICILYPYAGLIGNVIGVFFVNVVSPLGALDLIGVVVNIPALYCIIIFRKHKYLKSRRSIARLRIKSST